MNNQEEKAEVLLAFINHDLGKTHQLLIGETSSSRSSGFPRIAQVDESIYVSYTYVDSTFQEVITKRVNF